MHRPDRLIILLGFCAAGIFFYSGCSSTSNAVRYNDRREKQSENNSAVRFSSDKNETEKSDNENIDTVNTYSAESNESDPDVIPPNTNKVDISEILRKYSTTTDKNVNADKSDDREKMLMEIIKYLDTPYKFGGNTKRGIDCSAFTKAVYEKALSVDLERSARQQYHEGHAVEGKNHLEFGDLVFFNTRRRVKPGHVGIYIGDHLFAHASSSNGVTVSSLKEAYFARRYMGARRIVDMGRAKAYGRN